LKSGGTEAVVLLCETGSESSCSEQLGDIPSAVGDRSKKVSRRTEELGRSFEVKGP
jgi:hypothetical protein